MYMFINISSLFFIKVCLFGQHSKRVTEPPKTIKLNYHLQNHLTTITQSSLHCVPAGHSAFNGLSLGPD